ncbi:hypothetical protein Y032_0015g2860 [Ancylostoma ceylanicum]|uniref:SCP domain-containing protein n=1 Tax=Ancylostoma ceylanicum TaxID=53326 RepID=A0A016V9Z0_9BILA|nr:hypothetical protein Y032_0015g2860 [Ancylostoma ceylanicum]
MYTPTELDLLIFYSLLLVGLATTRLSRFNCTDMTEGALQPSQREHLWHQVTISMRLWIGPRYNCTLEKMAASKLNESVLRFPRGKSRSASNVQLSHTSFRGKKIDYKGEKDFFYKASRSWLTNLVMLKHKQYLGCSLDSTGLEYRIICLYN